MTATVKIAYVNDPKPGKKYGSIKSDDGTYYEVTPEMLPQFKQGETYSIEYSTRSWQGKEYRTVSRVTGAEAAAPQNGQQSPQVAPQQAAATGYGEDRSRRIERQHSQHMAILVVNALISQGVISTEEEAVKKIAALTDSFQIDVGKLPEQEVF